MSINDIIAIGFAIYSILSSVYAFYLQTKNKITDRINGLIKDEEDTENKKEAKMTDVVNQLYNLVPFVFKPVLSKTVLEKLVQKAFDSIEAYATKQLNEK